MRRRPQAPRIIARKPASPRSRAASHDVGEAKNAAVPQALMAPAMKQPR